ncbi:hypothetical protein [Streptomyces sp. FH025]|uniref:hypothetical protein n=1 Tax=Streptomyces sp. FH025 TaxID=2815937 RepID=UPI001A9D2A38|nr:hypothetical protein [Streptomyces sp. FH025]MBO1415366.1 hypothetical protein [Streptomyces sp. FH025]
MGKNRRPIRAVGVGVSVALLVTGAAACSSDKKDGDTKGTAAASTAVGTPSAAPTSKGPEAFAAAGYRGLKPGMAKDAGLASGALEAAPVSLLDGCTDFVYKGGPAPDQTRMAAEAATEARYKDLNAKADAASGKAPAPAGNGSAKDAAASAKNSAAVAKLMADATQSIADMWVAREARDKAFLTTGRVSFAASGLRELVAPAEAKTAEGIGAGSTADDLQRVYGGKGLLEAKNGKYLLPVEGQQGWEYEFTMDGGKVAGMAVANRDIKCV